MTFIQKFDDYVCLGDTITCTVDGYIVTARIAHDETPDAPDERHGRPRGKPLGHRSELSR